MLYVTRMIGVCVITSLSYAHKHTHSHTHTHTHTDMYAISNIILQGEHEIILDALKNHLKIPLVVAHSCMALQTLAKCEEERMVLIDSEALSLGVEALEGFEENEVVVCAACGLVDSLTASGECVCVCVLCAVCCVYVRVRLVGVFACVSVCLHVYVCVNVRTVHGPSYIYIERWKCNLCASVCLSHHYNTRCSIYPLYPPCSCTCLPIRNASLIFRSSNQPPQTS